MNTCANPDCDAWIPDDAFACTPHWRMLGEDLKRAVAETDDAGREMIRAALIHVQAATNQETA